jgi:hypothetical protein
MTKIGKGADNFLSICLAAGLLGVACVTGAMTCGICAGLFVLAYRWVVGE